MQESLPPDDVTRMLSRQSVPLPSGDTRPASSTPVKLTERWRPPTAEELSRELTAFSVEHLIACGGMGAVYRGVQKSLDRGVAIKVLSEELAKDAVFIARFQREARTLARLQHPGIVAVHDFGETPSGFVWFAMEFVDGTDLAQLLKSGTRPPVERVLEVMAQICDALQHAHDQNILHRDIKPANVMITKQGRAKLADFGLARDVEVDAALTMAHHTVGTPAYMAPEQLFGISDRRSDIYALGIIFYEMLTGHRPTGTWEVPSIEVGVDRKLDALVLKAINQDPDQRYQQAQELLSDIHSFRNGSTATSYDAASRPATEPPQQSFAALTPAVPISPTETSYPDVPGYDASAPRRPLPSPATELPSPFVSRAQAQRLSQPSTRPMSRAEAEQIRRPALPPIPPPPKPYAKQSSIPLWRIISGAAALAVLGLVMLLSSPKPELRVYDFKTGNARSSIEVQVGAEPDELVVEVKDGELDVQPRLPLGLHFDVPRQIGEVKLYRLSGAPLATAKIGANKLSLTARSGSNSSPKAPLTIMVKARPIEWQIDGIDQVAYVQNQTLSGYNKIVLGADVVTTDWSPSSPGIDVHQDQGDDASTWSLDGTPTVAGSYEVRLTAVAQGTAPQTRSLKVLVAAPPIQLPPPPPPSAPPSAATLGWREMQLPITLSVGQALGGNKVLVRGASTLQTDWLPAAPPGLSIRASTTNPTDWVLAGSPTTVGAFQLQLTAKPPGGTAQSRFATVYVSPRDMPSTGDSAVDRRMRDFLLERIERAPASFTDGEKVSLRQIVGSLSRPKRLAGIRFRADQSTLEPGDQRILRALLNNSENSRILAEKDCQILIVGYAPTATPAGTALSRQRAAAVDNLLRTSIGRGARLCGDYGPTDGKAGAVGGDCDVEIYVGILKIPDFLRVTADRFCFSFNQRHGTQ